MLILGITTSTARVGCAIGGHEGILGAVHSSRGMKPKPGPVQVRCVLSQQNGAGGTIGFIGSQAGGVLSLVASGRRLPPL